MEINVGVNQGFNASDKAEVEPKTYLYKTLSATSDLYYYGLEFAVVDGDTEEIVAAFTTSIHALQFMKTLQKQ